MQKLKSDKMKKIVLMVMLCMAWTLNADVFRVGDYEYVERNTPENSVNITGYYGSNLDVVTPAEVVYGGTTYKVVGIGEESFKGKPVRSLVVSEGIETIGVEAFAGTKLAYIVLPASMKRIGARAFLGVPVKLVRCLGTEPPLSQGYYSFTWTNTIFEIDFEHIFKSYYYSKHIDANLGKEMSAADSGNANNLDDDVVIDETTPIIDAILEVPAASMNLYARNFDYVEEGVDNIDWKYVWGYFYIMRTLESGVEDITAQDIDSDNHDIYDVAGQVVLKGASESDLRNLPKGIYIYKGRKIII